MRKPLTVTILDTTDKRDVNDCISVILEGANIDPSPDGGTFVRATACNYPSWPYVGSGANDRARQDNYDQAVVKCFTKALKIARAAEHKRYLREEKERQRDAS